VTQSSHHQLLDRAAAAFVLCVLAVGTFALWIGIPLGGAWALGELIDTPAGHYLAGIVGIPLAMVLFAPVLFWLNRLYLRIRQASHVADAEDGWEEAWDPEGDEPRLIPRGPLEPLLFISFAIALVAFIVWFFVFAENPLLR
jgi:hypothetical protein